MIITIDGTAGTGKTTVAKRVAERLHFSYFDTGAMYRSVAWAILQQEISLKDLESIEKLLQNFSFYIQEVAGVKRYFAQNTDVTEAIRTPRITAVVSEVSAMAPVRASLTAIQRSFAGHGDAVFEGRDMGSVVFPNAEVKVFLTARPEIRAERRLQEYLAKMPEEAKSLSHEQILKDLMRRDEMDASRTLAPLRCPEDAFIVDTSDLTIEQVVETILSHIKEKFPTRVQL